MAQGLDVSGHMLSPFHPAAAALTGFSPFHMMGFGGAMPGAAMTSPFVLPMASMMTAGAYGVAHAGSSPLGPSSLLPSTAVFQNRH